MKDFTRASLCPPSRMTGRAGREMGKVLDEKFMG